MTGKVRGDTRVHSLHSSGDTALALCSDAPGRGGGLGAVRGHLLAVELVNGQAHLELDEYDREVCVTRVNDAYNWSCVAGFGRM